MIPFLELRSTYSKLRGEIDEAVGAVLGGGRYFGIGAAGGEGRLERCQAQSTGFASDDAVDQ